jgi:restriction system protein
MARRSTRTPAEDIVDLLARLSWKPLLGLAVIAFLVLHVVAGIKVGPPTAPTDVLRSVLWPFIRTFAGIGQWIVPLLILVAIPFSVARRNERQLDALQAGGAEALATLSWREFEQAVAQLFRRQGFDVRQAGGAQADGGVDLRAVRGRDSYPVQCKHWRARTVGVEVVRELYGVMAAERSAGGFVVTSGRFTRDAIKFADGREIQLIDGKTLLEAIQRLPSNASLDSAARAAEPRPAAPPVLCPVCQSPMVRRQRRGAPDSEPGFLGCSRFPLCRGTRPMGR